MLVGLRLLNIHLPAYAERGQTKTSPKKVDGVKSELHIWKYLPSSQPDYGLSSKAPG